MSPFFAAQVTVEIAAYTKATPRAEGPQDLSTGESPKRDPYVGIFSPRSSPGIPPLPVESPEQESRLTETRSSYNQAMLFLESLAKEICLEETHCSGIRATSEGSIRGKAPRNANPDHRYIEGTGEVQRHTPTEELHDYISPNDFSPIPSVEFPSPYLPNIPSSSIAASHDYTRIRLIGSGSEGSCTLVRHNATKQLVALKTVIRPHLLHGSPDEGVHLSSLSAHPHPNIIHLYAFTHKTYLETPFAEYYLEYHPLGDLHTFISAHASRETLIPEAFIWKVFAELTCALSFLHQGFYSASHSAHPDPNIPLQQSSHKTLPALVHRDIKPENILLAWRPHPPSPQNPSNTPSYPTAILTDFGHATRDFASYTPSGTETYWPPEHPRASPKGDVWAAGCVVYEMITRRSWGGVGCELDLGMALRYERGGVELLPGVYSGLLGEVLGGALEEGSARRWNAGALNRRVEEGWGVVGGGVVEGFLGEWVWEGLREVAGEEKGVSGFSGGGCTGLGRARGRENGMKERRKEVDDSGELKWGEDWTKW